MPVTNLQEMCDTIVAWLAASPGPEPNWSAETWQTFQRVSRVHGVAPILHQTLQGRAWLPDALSQDLADQFDLNSRRISRMQAELKVILALFGQSGVPVIPLKGSVLSVEYYEQPGWRPMADLDVLIQPHDFKRSAQLLRQLGYEPTVVHWKHTEFSKPDNRQVISTTGEHPDNPRGLELHCYCRESFGGPTVDLTQLMWLNASPGRLLGERAIIVKPEVLWLHLLVHSSYHLWQGKGRLIQLLDLVRLTPHLTEPLLYLNAVEARFVYPSLNLLHRYFPTHLTEQLLAAQTERVSGSFQAWANSLDLVNASHLNPAPTGLYLSKALKFSEGRPGEVLQALRFAFWPTLAEIGLDHPRLAASRLAWLGYLLLPLTWLKRLLSSKAPGT